MNEEFESTDKKEYDGSPVGRYRQGPDGTVQYIYEPKKTIEDLLKEHSRLLREIREELRMIRLRGK